MCLLIFRSDVRWEGQENGSSPGAASVHPSPPQNEGAGGGNPRFVFFQKFQPFNKKDRFVDTSDLAAVLINQKTKPCACS